LPDGRPDFQGTWLHSDSTPLVRPAGFPALISPQQAVAIETLVYSVLLDPNVPNDPVSDITPRHISPIRGALHSSIVIEPEDGLIPGTVLFMERTEKNRFNILNAMDGPEQRPTSERCLGNPASQPPNLYNPGTNMHQIVQTKDTILFFSEVMHDARVIRLHATHAPAAVTSWLGDSIGWWEGDTLVVDTTNFTGKTQFNGSSDQLHVVERIRRIDANTLLYRFTIEDPSTWDRAWTGEYPWKATKDQIYEYACHEGNYAMGGMLRGARQKEAEDAAKKQE
jgi:hypothetical protein